MSENITKETDLSKSCVLPEGCMLTRAIRDARYRIAHVVRDLHGNFSIRYGWLVTYVVCQDSSRVCIQYDRTDIFIDVPANEIVILSCTQSSKKDF